MLHPQEEEEEEAERPPPPLPPPQTPIRPVTEIRAGPHRWHTSDPGIAAPVDFLFLVDSPAAAAPSPSPFEYDEEEEEGAEDVPLRRLPVAEHDHPLALSSSSSSSSSFAPSSRLTLAPSSAFLPEDGAAELQCVEGDDTNQEGEEDEGDEVGEQEGRGDDYAAFAAASVLPSSRLQEAARTAVEHGEEPP